MFGVLLTVTADFLSKVVVRFDFLIFAPIALRMDQLTENVDDLNLDSSLSNNWETVTKKGKKKAGSSAAKTWGAKQVTPNAWEQPNRSQKLGTSSSNNGIGKATNSVWNNRNAEYSSSAGRGTKPASVPNTGIVQAISPPLQHGWNWAARSGATSVNTISEPVFDNEKEEHEEDGEEEDDQYSDDDDDFISEDDFDSDASQKSHNSRKRHRMLRSFFETLDKLTMEEMSESTRQWHCPACQGGPGAIDWYKGLQPLLTHARTKGSKRVQLHREFARLLDEELKIRGTSAIPYGEAFGQWEGLKQEAKDHEIVWPPMVVIMNSKLDKDDNGKWVGMGNKELLEYFGEYKATRARHSYGPQGHRGMSVLIFEDSAVGYLEAERLHKVLLEQGFGREAWNRRRGHQAGMRQLYGFMAVEGDLDLFNQHSHGKSRLKFEMKSYQEKVVCEMRKMHEDNQQLTWLKGKVDKQKMQNQALEKSNTIMRESIRSLNMENRIVRSRSKLQYEEDKEQMDFLEQFHQDRMRQVSEATDEKEDNFEKLQQMERKKMEQSTLASAERADNLAKFIKLQDKEMEEFVSERDILSKIHEDKKLEMKKRHCEEELQLEKEFDAKLTKLMEKYTPKGIGNDSAVNP